MVEESSPLLPPAEESIEAETDTAFEPEPKSDEPSSEPASEPSFVCGCENLMRSACTDEPFYKEHEGKTYCVLHYPSAEKSIEFQATFHRSLYPARRGADYGRNFLGVVLGGIIEGCFGEL